MFRDTDLKQGERLLLRAGLLHESEDAILLRDTKLAPILDLTEDVALEVLLEVVLTAEAPLWLYLSGQGEEVLEEQVPDLESDRIRSVIPDPNRREALLLSLAQRVDLERNKAIGDLAEAEVEIQLRAELAADGREDLASNVRRVSQISDALGYDITAPYVDAGSRRIEVKGTTSSSPQLTIFLSRNEFRVGVSDPDWYLVMCRIEASDRVEVLGWCKAETLAPHAPIDQSAQGQWQTGRFSVSEAVLSPGLPPTSKDQ